jgi:hypothetical protein
MKVEEGGDWGRRAGTLERTIKQYNGAWDEYDQSMLYSYMKILQWNPLLWTISTQ